MPSAARARMRSARKTKMPALYAIAASATPVNAYAAAMPTRSPGGTKLSSAVAIVPM